MMLYSLLMLATCTLAFRGVQEANKNHFTVSSETFRCLDGSSEVPVSFVNDEYCDCIDGSDEPGTSACTLEVRLDQKWKFQCTDTSFMTKEILHSHINDGVCDCCDGSDEYQSGSQCQNTCAEAHKKAAEEHAVREAKRQLGLHAKGAMLAEVQEQRSSMRVRLEEEQASIGKLEDAIKTADDAVKEAEILELAERSKIKEQSEKEHEAWKVEQAAKNALLEEQKKLEPPQSEQIICSKWRQTKDCIGSGERQPEDDKECDAEIPDGWSGYCDCVDTESGSEVRHEFDCGHKALTCSYVCTHNGAEPESLEKPAEATFKVNDGSQFELPAASLARQDVREKRRALEQTEQRIKELEADLARDFGPEDVMLSLKSKCFEFDQREYTYKLCPFSDVQQMRKGSSHGTNMGRWKGFGEQSYSSWGSKQDYSHFLFTDGEHCWGGPNRSVDVHVVCGAENKLINVEEPSMCTYKMVFETPAACE